MTNTNATYKLQRINNNMDAVRYILALAVVVAHFNILCGFGIPFPMSSGTGVSGFFALSGFLIFQNYDRDPSVKRFLLRRGLRILPPYFLVVLVCAFGLVTVSSFTLTDYFCSPEWIRYVVSNMLFLNFLEPSLPGVFEGAQYYDSVVNGSLWTMKVEWCLYLSVPPVSWLLWRLRLKETGRGVAFLIIVIFSIAYRMLFIHLYSVTGREIFMILERQVFGQLAFFYVGALIYDYLDTFLKYRWLILALLGIGLLGMRASYYAGLALQPFVEGGLVLWFSMVGRWGHYLSRHDNVSYDIYLFHFPVMQLAVYFGLPSLGAPAAFTITLAVLVGLAFISWNCVGKKFAAIKTPSHKKC